MNNTLFLHPDRLSVSEFAALCEQPLTLSDYPLAADAQKKVLIYRAQTLLDSAQTDKVAVFSELHRALSSGPGVLVIKNAYPDLAVIARHNRVFEAIFQAESANGGGGDHFAAAGSNGRIWNSLQKAAEQDADAFIDYYANPTLALVSEAWLGPWYQMTAQVNVVRPGGKAQQPHRDYHLGFQENRDVQRFPLPLQQLSQYLTLQGAVAHSAMPLESGPTQLLPFSQRYAGGYLAWRQPAFIDYFQRHAIQLPLEQGDALFFNPALFHAAGDNLTADRVRIANLLQISSAFGKPMETVNRLRLLQAIYPALRQRHRQGGLGEAGLAALVAAAADGYSFPTNLDSDPPIGGLAPQTQQQLLLQALDEDWDAPQFTQQLERQRQLRSA
ncbi:phytanoyl-CoA dioxygenase family protein [Serratia ficaria]|uniref:phytanoyl-CoA dioxygenase family protein n=1 Tax=Serratia ficaria TaxID=61651 RepID=UPI0021776C35|nr:phytanoyl-CoA dioxygenase family protein [Serratia ficaria]CAI1225380.1 Phytanoyl-CoA dioxygenase (PhyH) [Serratia ficaria]CAI1227673.1 Phytanoyl-CoA dioxygenase (PhyH) [Serratia ficaria]CAI2019829.1 Phytanoyl-CoA dioxygenase (PhyH) [Serratia ficaria]CAI2536069.1 Phytanoyl-CoA dioxygenase (PhyH) [Serratia ficaria]CAI2537499.1 Phytanoyl-CoA dioxygenase (PhyH) [Serratia ficaria]